MKLNIHIFHHYDSKSIARLLIQQQQRIERTILMKAQQLHDELLEKVADLKATTVAEQTQTRESVGRLEATITDLKQQLSDQNVTVSFDDVDAALADAKATVSDITPDAPVDEGNAGELQSV